MKLTPRTTARLAAAVASPAAAARIASESSMVRNVMTPAKSAPGQGQPGSGAPPVASKSFS
jgi:hypothetical protein